MLWWKGPDGARLVPAEAIRTMLASLDEAVGNYRGVQHADALTICLEHVAADTATELRARPRDPAQQFRVEPPPLVFRQGLPQDSGFKRRRIRLAMDQVSEHP